MNVRELRNQLATFPDTALIGGATKNGKPPFDVHAVTAVEYTPWLGMTGLVILFNQED